MTPDFASYPKAARCGRSGLFIDNIIDLGPQARCSCCRLLSVQLEIRGTTLARGEQEYPKMLHHWDGTNRQRVGSRDQEAALGPEWFDSHAKAGEELNRRLGAIQSQR